MPPSEEAPSEKNTWMPCTINGEDHYASGGSNLFFDANRGPNMWEYYFEPVSSYRPSDPEQPRALPSRTAWELHHLHEGSVFAYPYGMYAGIAQASPTARANWYRDMRQRGHATVSKYLRLRPHIRSKADAVWSYLAAPATRAPVLGVHVRATDKLKSIGGDSMPS